jgi:hypothetical protein
MYVNINKTYSNCWKRTIYIYIYFTCATFWNELSLAKFTSVSCGMLNRRVMIKSPADALLKHRFVFRQVSCVEAQGDNVLLSGRELDGLCTPFQFSFPQGLLLNRLTTTWGTSAAFFLLCQSNRHKLVHCSHATFQPV